MNQSGYGGVNEDREGFAFDAEESTRKPTNFTIKMEYGGLAVGGLNYVGLNDNEES